MAAFKTDGFDELIRGLEKLGNDMHSRIPAALNAGADVLVEAQKAAVPISTVASGHSGHLRDHIQKGRMTSSSFESTIEVYPDGIRDDGERYATVAFVLEHGTSRMQGTKWMTRANNAAKAKVQEAMRRELEKT